MAETDFHMRHTVPLEQRHLPVVVVSRRLRDRLQRRYRVRCWRCDLDWPFDDVQAANYWRVAFDHGIAGDPCRARVSPGGGTKQ